MINSKGSSVVVGDEGSQCWLAGAFVVPDRGGEREYPLQDRDVDATVGSTAVLFKFELAFEGVVDRLDDLAQRFEESRAGSRSFVLERGSQQPSAGFGEERFELGAGVALVSDDGLTLTVS